MDLGHGAPLHTSNDVGVVVIGRNEGQLLHRCLTARGIQGRTTVYVDSGSTDGSLELARSLGVMSIALDSSRRFSVSRGRNAGLAHLKQFHPDLAFIQFLDGDVEIDEEFIAVARDEMHASPRIGAVAGHLQEEHHTSSNYKRLLNMEWHREPGESDIFSGNVMLRLSALEDTGWYDENLSGGEDIHLAHRFRRADWRIRTIDAPMGLHESEMHAFDQWWTRAKRDGYGVAEGAAQSEDIGNNYKMVRSIAFWSGAVPLLMAVSALLGLRTSAARLGLGAGLLYPLQWWRLRGHRLKLGDSPKDARIYATFVLIGKFAGLSGLLRYRMEFGRRTPS